MTSPAERIFALDPLTYCREIACLLTTCEFSWDIERALEFALFRTYAVPSISGILARTGEFECRPRKRYDDTELILSEILENGFNSARGRNALARMNEMHGRFRIANEDMLYVLSTFVFEPIRWLEQNDVALVSCYLLSPFDILEERHQFRDGPHLDAGCP